MNFSSIDHLSNCKIIFIGSPFAKLPKSMQQQKNEQTASSSSSITIFSMPFEEELTSLGRDRRRSSYGNLSPLMKAFQRHKDELSFHKLRERD